METGEQRLLFFQPLPVTILRGVLAWQRRLSLALPISMRDNFPKTDCRKLQCLDLEGSGQWTADRNNLELTGEEYSWSKIAAKNSLKLVKYDQA